VRGCDVTPMLPSTTLQPPTPAATNAECTECAGRLNVRAALPGEIIECADCGAELEVRTVSPLTLALAPEVEEDWGE